MADDVSEDQPGSPNQVAPASAYEGRPEPEEVPSKDEEASKTRPTGGVPSSAAGATGPDAEPIDEERKRESGGAPEERGQPS